MKFFYVISILIALIPCNSQASQGFIEGNTAYEAGDYEDALMHYKSVESANYYSSALYFNMGNSYVQLDSIGLAVWSFQKALKIDPSNERAITNLELLESKIEDDIQLYDQGFKKWLTRIFFGVSVNFWSYISLVVSLIFCVLMLVYFLKKGLKKRTFLFYSIFGFGILLIGTLILGYAQNNRLHSVSNGVVTVDYVEVKNQPSLESSTSLELHEGAKFVVLREVEGWISIKIGENEGWLKEATVKLY